MRPLALLSVLTVAATLLVPAPSLAAKGERRERASKGSKDSKGGPANSRSVGSKDDLSSAVESYQKLDYAQCLAQLEKARSELEGTGADAAPRRLAELYVYFGLCHFGQGDSERARQDFRAALERDNTIELPAGTAPKIRRTFSEVHQLLEAEGLQRRQAEAIPPAPAASARVEPGVPAAALPGVDKTETPAPPKSKSWLPVAGLGAVAAAGAVTGYLFAKQLPALEEKARMAPNYGGPEGYRAVVEEGKTKALGANIAFAAGAAAAVGAVLYLVL